VEPRRLGRGAADAAPDFEFDFSRAVGPLHGVFGLDEVRGLWDEFVGGWEATRMEVDELVEAGEQVVILLTARTRGRDGIDLTARPAYVATLRDGAIVSICMYQEREDALRATGLHG